MNNTEKAQSKQYSPEAIANNIIWLAQQEEKTVTPMKLLKLVYFVYGWALALKERKLFNEPVQAWKHGPVIPSLYYQFQGFGSTVIDTFATSALIDDTTGEIKSLEYPVVDKDDTDIHTIISAIWDSYKDCGAWTLSSLTHEKDSPWSKAWDDGNGAYDSLNDEDIKQRCLKGFEKKYGSGLVN